RSEATDAVGDQPFPIQQRIKPPSGKIDCGHRHSSVNSPAKRIRQIVPHDPRLTSPWPRTNRAGQSIGAAFERGSARLRGGKSEADVSRVTEKRLRAALGIESTT